MFFDRCLYSVESCPPPQREQSHHTSLQQSPATAIAENLQHRTAIFSSEFVGVDGEQRLVQAGLPVCRFEVLGEDMQDVYLSRIRARREQRGAPADGTPPK